MKELFVGSSQHVDMHHLLPFRKNIRLVRKVEALLQDPGQQLRVIVGGSLLVVVPDEREISFDVPLDRKTGQCIGEITTDSRRRSSLLFALLSGWSGSELRGGCSVALFGKPYPTRF